MGSIVTKEMPLSQYARGRNGVFLANEAEIIGFSHGDPNEDVIELAITSKKKGHTSPIWVYFTPLEAAKLGKILLEMAREVQQ